MTGAWLLAALVVALEVPYPLVHGGARSGLTVATVLVFAAAAVEHAWVTRSARTAVAVLVTAAGVGFAAEVVGVHTGLPFGSYRYTGGLGVTAAAVPVVVGLAWLMMAYPSACVALRLARSLPARVAVAAWALAAWDVFLDPQMVAARHWRWADPSPHLPGVGTVPVSNFGGWLLVATVLMSLLVPLASRRVHDADDRPPLVLWTWTWLSSALANVAFFGRPAVAGWGALAMGAVGVPLLVRLRARP